MASVIHIAEVAAILAVAYAIGWALGYFGHLLSAPRAVVAGVPAERFAAVTGAPATAAAAEQPVAEQPVAVPVAPEPTVELPVVAAEPTPIAPVASEPAPVAVELVAATTEPVVAVPEPVAAVAVDTVAAPVDPVPEPVAAIVTPPPVLDPPTTIEPPRLRTTLPPIEVPPLRIDPLPPLRKVAPTTRPPETTPEPEPEVILTAAPALKPGQAWGGEIRGRAAAPLKPEPPSQPADEVFNAPSAEMPFTLELSETIAFVAEAEAAAAVEAVAIEPDSTDLAPPVAVEAVEPAVAEPEPVAQPTPAPAPRAVYDEDAAMRAIEGGWSRVKARAFSDAPELSDVGTAVAAAQTAVEQVLAQAGIDVESSQRASRPEGLAGPRAGRKDDLKRIDGLGALDESTLNNLGVYHFDQIAGWDEAQVLWMENHVFARGRIGRETWQQQARDLAAAVAG